MKKDMIELKRICVRNDQDIDIYIRDAYGREHTLFPRERKKLMMIIKGGKSATCNSDS